MITIITPSSRRTAQATGGGGGVVTLFSDNFASGDFSHTQNGISWASPTFAEVITVPSAIAPSPMGGTKCVRFDQGDSVNDAELQFQGIGMVNDLYVQWYLYLPIGTESPGVGPKVKVSGHQDGLNDKFFRLWGDMGDGQGYSYGAGDTSGHPYSSKVGASCWNDGSEVDANLGFDFSFSDTPNQWPTSEVGGDGQSQQGSSIYYPFPTNADRGRWIQVRVHAKLATVANNNGVLQLYVDGVQKINLTHLQNGDIYGTSGPHGWTDGYLQGFANNHYQAGQYTYLAGLTFSTGGFTS